MMVSDLWCIFLNELKYRFFKFFLTVPSILYFFRLRFVNRVNCTIVFLLSVSNLKFLALASFFFFTTFSAEYVFRTE